jgi:nuclear pore complex protein Nup188
LFEINSDSLVDNISQIVETHLPVHVPGVEGLFIPSKTRGHALKVIGGNTALVRWEVIGEKVSIVLIYIF